MIQQPAPDASPVPTVSPPQQQEMPLALLHGQPVLQIPQDLYIPPDALEVILEAFEGPLDLLLYLIRRQNLDILDIPVAEITRQYVQYISVMQELRFELAAEYLVMAAILAEIKSRLLLPRPPAEEGVEDDPRIDLIRRLQEYERYKQAAEDLDTLPRLERDTTPVHAWVPPLKVEREPPAVPMQELLVALVDVLRRAELFSKHAIQREALSVRQRMSEVLGRLADGQFHTLTSLLDHREGRLGVIVSFLATLELAKEQLVEIVQETQSAPIYLRSLASDDADDPAAATDTDTHDAEAAVQDEDE